LDFNKKNVKIVAKIKKEWLLTRKNVKSITTNYQKKKKLDQWTKPISFPVLTTVSEKR
jgi:hypothetical protein